MKKKISQSMIISRIEKLEEAVFVKGVDKNIKNDRSRNHANVKKIQLDFSKNIRAFMSKYATKKSGPKKIVLLLAYLSKGEIKKDITVTSIKTEWSKMRGKKLLGTFNTFYLNEAKTKGWIDSHGRGTYSLTKDWKEVL